MNLKKDVMWPIGKCLFFSKILLAQFPEGYKEFFCVCVVHYWSSWLNILPLPHCSLLNQALIKVKNTKKRERALQIQYYFKYYYCFRSLLICSISSQYLNQRISRKQLQFLLQKGKKNKFKHGDWPLFLHYPPPKLIYKQYRIVYLPHSTLENCDRNRKNKSPKATQQCSNTAKIWVQHSDAELLVTTRSQALLFMTKCLLGVVKL